VISGPSFLGLNDPPPRKRNTLGLEADSSNAGSSGNLDYLLEDEEEPQGGGAWKFILIVVALALAVGLGYLRWKNQGFGWLNSVANKPAAATQPSDSGDSNTSAPANSTPSPSSDSSSNSSPTSSPAQPSAAQPPPAQPAADSASSTPGAPASPASNPSGNAAPSRDAAPAANQPAALTPSAATDKDKDSDTAPAEAPAKTQARTKPAAANIPAKPSPAQIADPVSEAQKYIYGKGVRQDCDHGLHLLKPAADHANPKAMIEMGALYSAGLCTPRDLPTAYRWFALALRKQPDNTSVQTDLQKLWGEMTQPERQLAIRLSQ
jgi:hypothetical protein